MTGRQEGIWQDERQTEDPRWIYDRSRASYPCITSLIFYPNMWFYIMDEWTMKTPNPVCWLFFKIDLLTDFAALCLTDFIDWRYNLLIGLYFQPSLWTVAPMEEGTILVYCCPSSFSLTSPFTPSQIKCNGCPYAGNIFTFKIGFTALMFFTLKIKWE
jgi:hypothetical protein